MKILVSGCLMGIRCRYDGKSTRNMEFPEGIEPIPFCPEVYGGLTTPRDPAEIRDGRVISKAGRDVTREYTRGAEEAVALCRRLGITAAVMQDRSPSCGKGQIHNGLFDGGMTEGDGVTVQKLKEAGICVFSASEVMKDPRILTNRQPEVSET